MNHLLRLLGYRLAPAILSAAGVTLLAAGLLSYGSPLPSPSPSPTPTSGWVIASPAPTPGASAGASASPSASPGAAGVATRVEVPALRIDLPVISGGHDPIVGGTSFPYCDVAEYIPWLAQPGQPGVTYIYAHARTGMFLPLLDASQVNDGKGMLGYTVLVYTSADRVYWYSIGAVKRHVPYNDLQALTGATSGPSRLILQTSEGPLNTSTKLQITATLQLVQDASPADAHPTPHPRVCS